MASGNFTKLDAVNRILRGAREHPVSQLDSDNLNDTLLAEDVLDDQSMHHQMSGLHCNTVEKELDPDSTTNRIQLPDNTLQAQAVKNDAWRDISFRWDNGVAYLYDNEDATFEFDGSIDVRYVVFLDFEDLPIAHQMAIADAAAVEYQMTVVGSNTLDRALRSRAALSMVKAKQFDARTRNNNIFVSGRSNGPRRGSLHTPRWWR